MSSAPSNPTPTAGNKFNRSFGVPWTVLIINKEVSSTGSISRASFTMSLPLSKLFGTWAEKSWKKEIK